MAADLFWHGKLEPNCVDPSLDRQLQVKWVPSLFFFPFRILTNFLS
jgi:hypothetical protein